MTLLWKEKGKCPNPILMGNQQGQTILLLLYARRCSRRGPDAGRLEDESDKQESRKKEKSVGEK